MFQSQVPGLETKRIKTFIFCFLQYACLHSCRSTWSYCSGELSYDGKQDPANGEISGFTKEYLGYINFLFLFIYGASMLFLGQIGDKIGPKKFVLYGTISTSIIQFLIAILFKVESKYIYIFMILMLFNGVAQASAWPGLMAIMNNWQAKTQKAIIMGYFTACTNIGNILGDIYAAILIEWLDLPIMTPIYLSSILLMTISILNIFFLENETAKEYISNFKNDRTGSLIYKEDFNALLSRTGSMITDNIDKSLCTVNRDTLNDSLLPEFHQHIPHPKPPKKDSINMVTAWKLPNVAIYAFAFGCIKAVFYILAFWLPSYLRDQNLTQVAIITQMIEWGTIPGGILICYAGAYYEKRASLIVPALWIGTVVMVGINYLKYLGSSPPNGFTTMLYYLLVFLTGLLIGGVYNNVSGAIVIELSNMKELKGNRKSTSTVTSVVMGYGAVFAAFNQLIVPYIQSILFLYCGLNAIVAGLLLIPLIINEYNRSKLTKVMDVTL